MIRTGDPIVDALFAAQEQTRNTNPLLQAAGSIKPQRLVARGNYQPKWWEHLANAVLPAVVGGAMQAYGNQQVQGENNARAQAVNAALRSEDPSQSLEDGGYSELASILAAQKMKQEQERAQKIQAYQDQGEYDPVLKATLEQGEIDNTFRDKSFNADQSYRERTFNADQRYRSANLALNQQQMKIQGMNAIANYNNTLAKGQELLNKTNDKKQERSYEILQQAEKSFEPLTKEFYKNRQQYATVQGIIDNPDIASGVKENTGLFITLKSLYGEALSDDNLSSQLRAAGVTSFEQFMQGVSGNGLGIKNVLPDLLGTLETKYKASKSNLNTAIKAARRGFRKKQAADPSYFGNVKPKIIGSSVDTRDLSKITSAIIRNTKAKPSERFTSDEWEVTG